jgi:hypothetical protein
MFPSEGDVLWALGWVAAHVSGKTQSSQEMGLAVCPELGIIVTSNNILGELTVCNK